MRNKENIMNDLLKNINAGLNISGKIFASGPVLNARIKIKTSLMKTRNEIKLNGSFRTSGNENEISEFIIYRKKTSELRKILGADSISMLVNPDNTGGNICGLEIPDDNKEISSSWYTLIGNPDNEKYFLFAFKHPVTHRTFLRFRYGYFECGCFVQKNFEKNDFFDSGTLIIREAESPHKLLEEFGDACGKNIRIAPGCVGWNSWDYYFKIFEEKDLDENITAIKNFSRKSGTDVKMLMLDDGWFNDYGDWRTNGRFPAGLKKTADKIRKNGFEPGIWIAPFHLSYFSLAYQRNSEILASYRTGKKELEEWAFGPVGFLDPTKPEGEKFLSRTFKSLKDAGFSHFKVDFIHYLITFGKDKKFFRDELGKIEIVRRGLSIIRKAIGSDSYLITCGCPPEAAIGIADSNRIGGDISTYNSTVRINAQFLTSRYWMNSRLWTSDPDFLIVRSDATAKDIHHNPIHFNPPEGSRSGSPWTTEHEARLWATLAAMSGGLMVLSDHLGKLKNNGIKLLQTALKNTSDESATPLDLMENKLPEIWLREGKSPALAIVNWTEKKRTVKLSMEKYPGIRNFIEKSDIWKGLKMKLNKNHIILNIPPVDAAWFIEKKSN